MPERLLGWLWGMTLVSVLALGGATARERSCDAPGCDDAASRPIGPEVVIGYTQFFPFSGTSPSGVATGYSIDLLRLLLEPRGYAIHFVAHDNPASLTESLQAGEIDATTPLAVNPVRAQVGRFTNPVLDVAIEVITTTEAPPIATTADLDGLRIGVSQGSQPERLVREIAGAIPVVLPSSNALLLPLLDGTVDAVAAPAGMLVYQANRARIANRLRQTGIALNEAGGAFLVHPARAALLDDLNGAIAAARASGDLRRLHDKWFSPETTPLSQREKLIIALGACLAALLGISARILVAARRATRRARLLESALDATGAAVLLADQDLRPVWWNEGYARHFPGQTALLRRGTGLEDLIANGLQNGTEGRVFTAAEARVEARSRVAQLQRGGSLNLTKITPDGNVLDCHKMMLPSGNIAIIGTDVSKLARVNETLEFATRQLEDANQRLQDFNRVAAHDLMAPLRNLQMIHGWIRDDITGMGMALPEAIAEHFQHIDRMIDRQSRMIRDLLEYSQPLGDGQAISFDPTERFPAIVDLAGIPEGFEVLLPESAPMVHAEPAAFDLVLRNLISNAAKHHDRHAGEIRVTCAEDDGICVITVSDDGPGIPERHLESVFDALTTLKSRDEGAGSGLGLSFVQRTVQLWGGSVEAISRDGERGTSFVLTLPLGQPAREMIRFHTSLASGTVH